MTFELDIDDKVKAANVCLDPIITGDMILLSDTVFAFVDDGRLSGLEIIDTTQFGDPFDEAAAHRALDWAREQLADRATA